MVHRQEAGEKDAWKVIRRFEGGRSPEELLRALLQAHRA